MELAELNDRGLVLVGCGRMGGALLKGWLARGLAPGAVRVIDPNAPAWLAERGVATEGPLPDDPAVLVLAAGVATTFISGDLFHMYVGFEVLLGASFVLLTIGASKERVRAGISYVMVSMVSSLISMWVTSRSVPVSDWGSTAYP